MNYVNVSVSLIAFFGIINQRNEDNHKNSLFFRVTFLGISQKLWCIHSRYIAIAVAVVFA